MAIASHDVSLQQEFDDLLKYMEDPVCLEGELNLPGMVVPQISKNESLRFPLSKDALSKIEAISKPSPFGKDMETKIDENYRKGFELETNQFYFEKDKNTNTNSNDNGKDKIECFNSKDDSFVEKIRQSLASHVPYIECKPYKMMFYEKGGFFNDHCDTMRESGHFGTLLVSLPFVDSYEGGDLVLKYKNQTTFWNPNKNDNDNSNNNGFKYIAFYSDVSHKVLKVTQGIRITMSFNLVIPQSVMSNYRNYILSNENNLSQTNNPNPKQLLTKYYQKIANGIKDSKIVKSLSVPDDVIALITTFTSEHPLLYSILEKISFVVNNGSASKDNDNDNSKKKKKKSKKEESEEKVKQNGVCIVFAHRYAHKSGNRKLKLGNKNNKNDSNDNDNKKDGANEADDKSLKFSSDDDDKSNKFSYGRGRHHKQPPNVLNPLVLKGCDMEIYKFCKKYFSTVFLTPLTLKSVWGQWSDEYEDEDEAEQDDYEGRVIAKWDETDARTKWKLRCGKKWWEDDALPDWFSKKHPSFLQADYGDDNSKVFTIFVNKDATMANKDILDENKIHDECYGNCGVYDLENRYYCTGLLILNNVNDTAGATSNNNSNSNSNDNGNDNSNDKGKNEKRNTEAIEDAYFFQDLPAKKKLKMTDGTYVGKCSRSPSPLDYTCHITWNDKRQRCQYAEKCYRKNPAHFNEFAHMEREENDMKEITDKLQENIKDCWAQSRKDISELMEKQDDDVALDTPPANEKNEIGKQIEAIKEKRNKAIAEWQKEHQQALKEIRERYTPSLKNSTK